MKGNCNSKSFKVMAVTGISSLLLAVSALVPTSAQAVEYSGSVELSPGAPSSRTIEQVEYGAEWNHGSVALVTGWSYLMSSSHDHSSTVTAGGQIDSDTQIAGEQSKAQLWLKFTTFRAYYNIW